MPFNLGKPILVMIVCAVGAGTTSRWLERPGARADLEVWCFSDPHYRDLIGYGRAPGTVSPRENAERVLGKTVGLKLIQYRAMATRLGSLFFANVRSPEVPDLVDIEIGSVGRYLRPRVDEIGLLPLNDLLAERGWTGKIVESRFAPWSKGGVIFGVPQDVHPVMIAYDDVAFRDAGVDLSTSATWDQFIDNCLRYQAVINTPGQRRRFAFEMGDANASTLVTMLLQRGINLVDQDEHVHLADPRTLDTLVRYVRMMRGPNAIGGATGLGLEAFSQDLRAGLVSAFFCADWRLQYMKDAAPASFAGRMRVMALPAWPDSPYRTSTSGGSMTGIPRNARDPELSFRLLELLYLRPEAAASATKGTYILPAVKSTWQNPAFDEPDPYFGGQPVRRMIANLAAGVPPRYVSPASTIAEAELLLAMNAALNYASSLDDINDERLTIKCAALLEAAEGRLKLQVEHGRLGQ